MSIGYLEDIAYEVPEKCPYCGREHFANARKNGPHITIQCTNCGGWIHAKQCTGKNWAEAVKRRALYRCERCGKDVRGRGAHAHHKVPKWFMPELQYDINNGLCLCTECHKQLHGGTGTIKTEDPEDAKRKRLEASRRLDEELRKIWDK